ncbi:MAG TPA: hypothetical protein VNZ26_31060 [Vicinamibacterales bacterium]|nr:hypothetical protein [Vicinamibacterales bacterium]
MWGPDLRTLLSACATTGPEALEECEGQFVAIYADHEGAVHIVNDRFSSRPLYLLRTNQGTYFSSNLGFLLAFSHVSHRPDPIGWLQASAFAHTLGKRTTAEGVERLRPATHLTVTAERVIERQYWCLQHRPIAALDPAVHSEEVFQTFQTGTQRFARLADKGILALSGGLDSRLIAGALPGGYEAFTFVDKPEVDSTCETRAAAEVCSALGLRHRIEKLPAGFADPHSVIALTGGMRPYQHIAIVMAYVDEMRRRHVDFLLGGGPGDSLAGAFVPSAAYVDPAQTTECIEDACQRYLSVGESWSTVFRDDVIDAGRRAVCDELAESFANVQGPTAAHRVTAWAMVYRQSAFTFTSLMHTHPDVTEAACHLDYRYVDLMLQLPASWLYRRAFYSFMIYSALPSLRHVPYANTGSLLSGEPPAEDVVVAKPLKPRFDATISRGRSFARRAVRAFIPARGYAPSMIFRNESLLDEVEERFHSIALLRDILDVRRCEKFLARTRAGSCPSEEMLGALTSLCLSAAVFPNPPSR